MRQTTRIKGARVTITTNAAGRTTVKPAPPLEWELQAAQCAALRAMPEYGKRFLFAGDMAAGRRGKKERVIAKATGLVQGEPDLRIYIEDGRLLLIENKAGNGRLSPEQKARHAALGALGHEVVVIRADTCQQAAEAACLAVRGALGVKAA